MFIHAMAAIALLIIAGSFIVRCGERPNPESWKWNDPKELKAPGLRHGTLESASMKRTVGYCIYLPPQYEKEPERRFPVVFFLHGAGGTESSDSGLAYNVNGLIVSGKIEPVIYVFPNGGQTSGYRDWAETKGNVKAETLLIKELLPLIDKEYRTIAKPQARGICGFSMGGGGAIRLALKYPDLFGTVASLAGALDQSPDSADGDNAYRHATALSKENRERLHPYLVVGEDDSLFKRHAPFLKHLKETGIDATFVSHPNVGHNLGALNKLSADAMIQHLSKESAELLKKSEAKP